MGVSSRKQLELGNAIERMRPASSEEWLRINVLHRQYSADFDATFSDAVIAISQNPAYGYVGMAMRRNLTELYIASEGKGYGSDTMCASLTQQKFSAVQREVMLEQWFMTPLYSAGRGFDQDVEGMDRCAQQVLTTVQSPERKARLATFLHGAPGSKAFPCQCQHG